MTTVDPDHLLKPSHDSQGSDSASSFGSIEEAKRIFQRGYSQLRNSIKCDPRTSPVDEDLFDATIDHIPHIESLLESFSSSFDAMVEGRHDMLSASEEVSIAVLRLNLLYAQVEFNGIMGIQPAVEQMRQMNCLGHQIVSYIKDISVPGHTSFCLDMGYVIPLATVAKRCANFSVRREAIDILRMTSRQEGIWCSTLVAADAEQTLRMEQGRISVSGWYDTQDG